MSLVHSYFFEKVNWRSLCEPWSARSKKSGGISFPCLGPGLSDVSKSPDCKSPARSSSLLASKESSSWAIIAASGIRGDSFVLPSSGVWFYEGGWFCDYYCNKRCVYLSYSWAIATLSCSFSSLTLSCTFLFTWDFFRLIPFLILDGDETLLLLVSSSLDGSLNSPSIFRNSSLPLALGSYDLLSSYLCELL